MKLKMILYTFMLFWTVDKIQAGYKRGWVNLVKWGQTRIM